MNLPRGLRMVLWPFSKVYGLYVRWRHAFYARGLLKPKRLKATVISVGNLTVGGTGKTPMILWLADKFMAEGKKVAILSRGYGGSHGSSDEIELLKRRLGGKVLFGVGPDRFSSGSRLESNNTIDIFLLDDGFQHLQLARDLDIVMLDGSRKLKDEWLLPAGSGCANPLQLAGGLIFWLFQESLRGQSLRPEMLIRPQGWMRKPGYLVSGRSGPLRPLNISAK